MRNVLSMILMGAMTLTLGCSSEDSQGDGAAGSAPTGTQYLVSAQPANSIPVGKGCEEAKEGDEVAFLGRIGGSTEPFVDGLAAFTIVDPKVKFCPPEENCPTPWDYCCTQNEVRKNSAMVTIVDDQGKPVNEDARGLLGVKELALVVVQGIAKRDDAGNLSVNATRVFIKNE